MKMKGWKRGFVGLLYAAFVLRIGAVEQGRTQPTERISGGISLILSPFCSFLLNFISFWVHLFYIFVLLAIQLIRGFKFNCGLQL
jgi:hypothetical protein